MSAESIWLARVHKPRTFAALPGAGPVGPNCQIPAILVSGAFGLPWHECLDRRPAARYGFGTGEVAEWLKAAVC